MKNTVLIAALIALPFGLSACDNPVNTPKAETSADTMGDMATPSEPKLAKGSGTVTAIDLASGKITLDHGPIAKLEWPAMEMGFTAKRDLIEAVAVGDKVDFDIIVTGNSGVVTAVKKQ